MKADSYVVRTVALALGVAVLSAGAATAGEKTGTPSVGARDGRASATLTHRNPPVSAKIRALRKMWRDSPVFNRTDGLVDYGGEDHAKPFRKAS